MSNVSTEARTLPVFNLEIANAHTFFVGENGVLAHNGFVYCLRNPTKKPYIGKADNKRQLDDRKGKRDRELAKEQPGEKHEREVLYEGPETGRALEKKEQEYIDQFGGPTNKSNPDGGTSNKRNNFKKK